MNLLKKRKKYTSCYWLEHGIIFDHDNAIRVCCMQSHKGQGRHIVKHNYQGEVVDWNEIFKQKNIQREMHRQGNIFPACEGCPELQTKYWDYENYISRLLLTHWIHCDSKCIYCPAVRDEELLAHNKHYNVITAIKDMIDKKLLKSEAEICIAGGEAAIYPEFEELLSLFLNNKFKNIVINTSGLTYSNSLERGLKENSVKIIISLDSGTKKTHNKIKQVDSFDLTIENLKKYSANQKKGKKLVRTKYIILPQVNDNQEEIDSWLNLNKQIGINIVYLDADIVWYQHNSKNIPEHIKDLIIHAKKQAKSLGLKLILIERALRIYEEYCAPNKLSYKLRKLFR